jgi:hypothetical protein
MPRWPRPPRHLAAGSRARPLDSAVSVPDESAPLVKSTAGLRPVALSTTNGRGLGSRPSRLRWQRGRSGVARSPCRPGQGTVPPAGVAVVDRGGFPRGCRAASWCRGEGPVRQVWGGGWPTPRAKGNASVAGSGADRRAPRPEPTIPQHRLCKRCRIPPGAARLGQPHPSIRPRSPRPRPAGATSGG